MDSETRRSGSMLPQAGGAGLRRRFRPGAASTSAVCSTGPWAALACSRSSPFAPTSTQQPSFSIRRIVTLWYAVFGHENLGM
ncbi:hypothetical protein NKDENANG_00379 [Candidatus Entotheonellaceae bacterium PAL068K]